MEKDEILTDNNTMKYLTIISGRLEQNVELKEYSNSIKDFVRRIAKLPPKLKSLLYAATITPLFIKPGLPRTRTWEHSVFDHDLWLDTADIDPMWPYLKKEMFLKPDFTRKNNVVREILEANDLRKIINVLNGISEGIGRLTGKIKNRDLPENSDEIILLMRHSSNAIQSTVNILEFENFRYVLPEEKFAKQAQRLVKKELLITKDVLSYIDSPAGKKYFHAKDALFTSYVLNEKAELLENIAKKSGTGAKPEILIKRDNLSADEIFLKWALPLFPDEKPYDYRKRLLAELGKPSCRNYHKKILPGEVAIDSSWKIIICPEDSELLKNAADSFINRLKLLFNITLKKTGGTEQDRKTIMVGTGQALPRFGKKLKQSKDYQFVVRKDKIIICGFDELGAMFGLYYLETLLIMREAPCVKDFQDITRHSLFKTRIAMSCLGWMEWPDEYLEMLPRYGIDAIFVSPYANILGGGRYRGIGRIQSPAAVKELIKKAKKWGLKAYCQFVNQLPTNHDKNKQGGNELELIRRLITEFPEVDGYILLTEGFRSGVETINQIAAEAFKLNPKTEIIFWNYNGPVTPEFNKQRLELRKKCSDKVIPMLTWEKGCVLKLGKEWRYIYDYSISVIGPSEVWALKEIEISRKKGVRSIYVRTDAWNNWQFGTLPFLPFPYQWHKRNESLLKYKIEGTLDAWTYGFTPNFIAELKSWGSWNNSPPLDALLKQIAKREFGVGGIEPALKAWKLFSEAVPLIPDTGHSMLCNACAAPLFFELPPKRLWQSQEEEQKFKTSVYGASINPYWPYTAQWAFLFPDFSNQKNMAELYAKNYLAWFDKSIDIKILRQGEKGFSLETFLKYLRLAAEKMEAGLKHYRQAAYSAPDGKKQNAVRHVFIAEQIRRMLLSDVSILEFEDLRFELANTKDRKIKKENLSAMEKILKNERQRTIAFLETVKKDSQMGFECEGDYYYTPYILAEKIKMLGDVINRQIPHCRGLLK